MRFRLAISVVGIVVAVALFSEAALGQTIPTIQIGQTTSGSATSGVDLYRVGGASGTELTFTLTGRGSSGLILYTPDGEEMLTAEGTDTVRLSAILPLDDVFLVGVIRDQRTPYSLTLEGVESDGRHFASFAAWVGYSHKFPSGATDTQCWLDPGRQIKSIRSDGSVVVSTIGRGGKTYWQSTKSGVSRKWESLYTIEGNEVVRTSTYPDGRTSTRRYPMDDEIGKPNGGFVRYLCD